MHPSVVLLKEASASPDAYQTSLSSRNFNVSFLAPLRFRFSSRAIDRVATLLATSPTANNIAALVATSPRGIDAFLMAMKQVHDAASSASADSSSAMPTVNDGASSSSSVQAIADARGSRFSASLAQWSHRPFFVIGSESAKRFTSDPLAQLYGFHATTFDGVVNASQLGMRIRFEWRKICETFLYRYAEEIPAAAAMSFPPSLLALVGDKRRDELFEVLTAAEINRSPSPILAAAAPRTRADSSSTSSAPSSPRNPSSARNSPRTAATAVVAVGDLKAHQGSNVVYREETVYETVTADVPGLREGNAIAIEPTPFMQQFLHILHSIYSAQDSNTQPQQQQLLQQLLQSPIYIVFFSPSGVETFFAQLEYHKSVLEEQRRLLFLNLPSSVCPISSSLYSSSMINKFQFVAIGGTTAAAFHAYYQRISPLTPLPPLLISEKPNPEALSSCIEAAWKRMASSSLLDPVMAASIPAKRRQVLQHIPFYKYHGTLNDYVLIDGFMHSFTRAQLSQIARELCQDRRGAIGSDGLLFVTSGREQTLDKLREFDPEKQHVQGRMYMWNTDGSEAEMCGNGLRCCVKFIYDHKYQGLNPPSLCVLTGAGEKIARVTPDEFGLAQSISLQLGQPRLASEMHHIEVDGWTFTCHDISMGNPHCIVLLEAGINPVRSGGGGNQEACGDFPTIDEMDAHKFGKVLHDNPRYAASNGCNISFVSVRTSSTSSATPTSSTQPTPSSTGIPVVVTVDIRTYERGNGETWSCGSGISAAVCSVLCRRAGASPETRMETVQVFVKGGELAATCKVREAAPPSEFVKRNIDAVELSGPATEVFQGSFPIALNC